MTFRTLLRELSVLTEATVKTGTTRVWGDGKYQKQRDGRWLKLRKALPHELKGPSNKPVEIPKVPNAKRRAPAVPDVPIPVGKVWRDEVSDLPDSTMDEMFKEDGQPKPQRKALHERIFRTFLDHVEDVPEEKKPVAVILMGSPASGRSSAGRALSSSGLFTHSDPGSIVTLLPEYTDGVKMFARNAAKIGSDEAGFIGRRILDIAIVERKNIVLDTFGKHFSKLKGVIEELQENDYFVVAVLVEVSSEVGLKRATERGMKTGKWVPATAFNATVKLPRTFERVSEMADETIIFDTNGAPKLKESVLSQLRVIFERREPKNIAVSVAEVQRLLMEGLKRGRSEMESLPDKYTESEGIWLAHYDDKHLAPIETEPPEQAPPEGEPPAEPEMA